MRNAALFLSVLIILGGVGWFLFNSVPAVDGPSHQDAVGHSDKATSDSSDGDFDRVDGEPQAHLPAADTVTVGSFADCVAAGNPVMESYPRQCRHGGVLFVEDVAATPQSEEPVACTMDAKMCPDGSAVGRVGPNCEFAPCPGESTSGPRTDIFYCSPESRLAEACTAEYAPVCAAVAVQCVTTPCNPVPETFSNACAACMEENVVSYTSGACDAQ